MPKKNYSELRKKANRSSRDFETERRLKERRKNQKNAKKRNKQTNSKKKPTSKKTTTKKKTTTTKKTPKSSKKKTTSSSKSSKKPVKSSKIKNGTKSKTSSKKNTKKTSTSSSGVKSKKNSSKSNNKSTKDTKKTKNTNTEPPKPKEEEPKEVVEVEETKENNNENPESTDNNSNNDVLTVDTTEDEDENKLQAPDTKTSRKSPSPSPREKRKIPFYLQEGYEDPKKRNVGVKELTVHERKKNVKLLNLNRKNTEIDELWYNKLVDEYKRKNQNDKIELLEKAKQELNFREIQVEYCLNLLLTLDEGWEGRILIVEFLVNQLCDENITFEDYYLKLCRFLHALAIQFTDPRSLIIQGLRNQITRLAEWTPKYFIYFAEFFLEKCYPNMPVRIEAVREPAIELGFNIVKFCIDEDFKMEFRLLDKVIEGLAFKHDNTRTTCAALFNIYLNKFDVLECENMSDEQTAFLDKVDKAVRSCIKDANQECRVNGYRGLHIYETIAPNKSKEIIEKFSNAVTKKYNKIVEEIKKEQENNNNNNDENTNNEENNNEENNNENTENNEENKDEQENNNNEETTEENTENNDTGDQEN